MTAILSGAEIRGRSSVQVLGTHFNINSCADNGSIVTTLLEGKVKVEKQGRGPGAEARTAGAGDACC